MVTRCPSLNLLLLCSSFSVYYNIILCYALMRSCVTQSMPKGQFSCDVGLLFFCTPFLGLWCSSAGPCSTSSVCCWAVAGVFRSGSDDSEASDFDSDADDPGGSHGAGSVGDGDQREREARLAELHRQEAQLRELSLTRNQDALEALQVPPFEARLTPLPPPPWLSRILVKIRIVDFWHPDLPRQRGCATSRLFVQYLRHLGLDVVFTNHMTQIGCACGWVAARCSTDMAVAQDWKTCDVSRAVAQHWITVGNAILGTPGDESHFIGNEHVIELTNAFWNADCGERHEEPGPPCARCGEAHLSANCHKLSHPRLHDANDRHLGWLKTVTTSDHALRLLMEDLHEVTTTGASIEFRSIISNNQDSRSGGCHWFSIAFSAGFCGNDE